MDFPEVDQVSTALGGLITGGGTTTLHGAFRGVPDEDYLNGPAIWLRDDTGRWHVAEPRGWTNGGVIVFSMEVIPPVAPTATALDILIIGRTADVHAAVPLTWWTSARSRR